MIRNIIRKAYHMLKRLCPCFSDIVEENVDTSQVIEVRDPSSIEVTRERSFIGVSTNSCVDEGSDKNLEDPMKVDFEGAKEKCFLKAGEDSYVNSGESTCLNGREN